MAAWLLALMLTLMPMPESDTLFVDTFDRGLNAWRAELESGGRVEAIDGKLVVDVPAGATVWLVMPIEGPLEIEYDITAVSAGGPNDRVSDLNCFWMASDARSPDDLFATTRSGRFADYNRLRCYYVGMGGNTNTTTRFRRYIGDPDLRPILPEHDLTDARFLIEPNRTYRIRLVADGKRIEYWRDGELFFSLLDDFPYTRGHFGFRTVANHMEIRHFTIRRLRD